MIFKKVITVRKPLKIRRNSTVVAKKMNWKESIWKKIENNYRLYQNYVHGVRYEGSVWRMVREIWDYKKSNTGTKFSECSLLKYWQQFLCLKCYFNIPSRNISWTKSLVETPNWCVGYFLTKNFRHFRGNLFSGNLG